MTNLIDYFNKPYLFPDKTNKIDIVQTHISIVFIADNFVYKVKKPVNFGFLDFSTLEKRKYYCYQELNLNRRLAKDIYLNVLPVFQDKDRYYMGEKGRGDIVDYAVRMKRIPDDVLMKSIFERGELSENRLEEIATVLAKFHKNAQTSSEISRFGEPESFRVNTDENFEQVKPYVGDVIDQESFEKIMAWTNAFYENNGHLFTKRIKEDRIRDCHGDLHMEHICFTTPLSVIDCIEFNERFRYSDTIADIAFLLMDLEYHDGKKESETLWNIYKEKAEEDDHTAEMLLPFYKVYRAFVRGKVNSFQINDETIDEKQRQAILENAKRYFKLAHSYLTDF